MHSTDDKPHCFINVIKVPPYPNTRYTKYLDVVLSFVDMAAEKTGPLPGKLPLGVTWNCSECSFFIPCDIHRERIRQQYDKRVDVRKACKADDSSR